MFKQLNHNMGKYARFILRRDCFRIPIWVLSLTALTVVVAIAYTQLVPTEQDRMVMAETMKNPAVTAMFGPAWGLDNYHFGAIMGHQMLLFTALIVAAMAILLTARHTRGDEENGRIEVVRSLPVGRLSNLSATALVLSGASVLLALLNGLGLFALGLEGMDLHGSLLYGASLGATGIFFMAVTALFAQLSDNTRGTLGYSFAILGLVYLPALWVMSGAAALIVGLVPQGASATWLYLGYSFFVVYLGAMLQLPEWMAKLSPFGHIPKLPVEEADFVAYTVLAVIALALTVIGIVGYNKRDIQG